MIARASAHEDWYGSAFASCHLKYVELILNEIFANQERETKKS